MVHKQILSFKDTGKYKVYILVTSIVIKHIINKTYQYVNCMREFRNNS